MPDIPEAPFFMQNKILNFLVFFAFHPHEGRNFSLHQRCHLDKFTRPAPKEMTKPSKKIQFFYYY